MPRERTAVTAGDHIDWMTTSPEAIRLTDWSKLLQNARKCPAFLAVDQDLDRLVDLGLGHVALVAVLEVAAGLDGHRDVHDADRARRRSPSCP